MQTVRVITETLLRRAIATATTVVAAAALTVATLGIVCPRPASADAVTYSTSKKTYKVGVLLLDSTILTDKGPTEQAKGPENPDPYVFYIADQSTDIKPQGWELDNPLAPATVTTDIYERWGTRDPQHPYVVGQKVTKDMAAYWEVSLSAVSETELGQYDLLFITNHRNWKLTASDREKLRKVVDTGGVIWIEDCGGMTIDPDGRFFLDQLQFHGNSVGVSATAGPVIYQPTHPLLNTPFPLSFSEISNLGDKNYGNYYLVSQNATGGGTTNAAPNRETLTTIVGNKAATDTTVPSTPAPALPYIAAGSYGSGAVIATAGDSGCDINDYSGGTNTASGGNSGAYAGKELKAAHVEDLKFLYNMIAWGSANNTYRNNNRRTASSFAAVNAPLNKAFDFSTPAPPASVVRSNATPLISQGIMYVSGTSGNNLTLRAYDIQPNRDYDADGNNDDGIPDLIQGAPYDEIWRWTGPTVPTGAGSGSCVYPSSPVLATVTIGGQSGEMILINGPDGIVYAFNARPLDTTTGRLLPTNNPVYTNGPATAGPYLDMIAVGLVAPAPVFFGNKVYVVEPTGAKVRCINADGFGTLWTSTNDTPPYTATGAPTLGLTRLVVNTTRDPNRGLTENTIAGNTDESTNDVMLYVPVHHDADDKILPFWLGTRNEGTKDLILDGTNSLVRFRPAAANNEQYFISKGGNGFITPSVRLYAEVKITIGGAERVFSREENFAAGHSVYPMDPYFKSIDPTYNDTWTADWQDSTQNNSYYSGRVVITRTTNGTTSPAVPGIDKVLAVADYDLVYVPASGTPPDYLNGQGQYGHRNTGPLTIKGGSGLDTAALAPNDLLIYASNQTPTVGNRQIGSLFGMQEREFSLSASRLRWRFLMHNDTAAHNVNGVTFADQAAFRNRLVFTPGNPYGQARLMTAADNPNGYEPLTNVTVVGSPIVTNDGITYMLARGTSPINGAVTILMAMKAAPQVVLNVGQPILEGSAVTVAQWDPLSQSVVSTNGDSNDRTRLDVDYANGRITVADFGALNNGENLFSVSSSFVVTYQPVTSSTPQVAGTAGQNQVVVQPYATVPLPANANNPANTATGGFSPLLWYYVLPGTPTSSPTRIGNNIYFTSGSRIIAMDSDPASNDPGVRAGSGEQVFRVVDELDNNRVTSHIRWIGDRKSSRGSGAPVGGEGVLAVNTTLDPGVGNVGTVEFSEGVTLIADNTRIMEVNSEGAAIWATDVTVDKRTAGGAGPVYDPAAPGGIVNTNSKGRESQDVRPFRSPQTVRRLSASDYLVADTGNNRVVRFDRGGILRWSLEKLNDPYGVLAPGDPVTLNNPTDVLVRTLTTFNTSGARVGFEVHYMIADSGNNRVIDVVDYYDRDGQLASHPQAKGQLSGVVVWTTRTTGQGKRLAYHNIQLTAGRDGNLFGKPVLVASVSNTSVSAANNADLTDSSGGSLVQLDYNPRNTAFVLVNATGAAQTVKYYSGLSPEETDLNATGVAAPNTNGLVTLAMNELRFISNTGAITTKRINKPTYFEKLPLNLDNAGTAEAFYLLVDSDGAYVCTVPNPAVDPKGLLLDVLWQFTQTDYNQMNAASRFTAPTVTATVLPRFSPSSMKRLANGHFLITNSAVGPCALFNSGQFLGEVFEVAPPTFLFSGGGVTQTVRGGTFADFSAPRLEAKRDINNNVLYYMQQMGRDGNGATVTEQPRSADRL